MLRRLKWGRISNFVRRLIFCSTDDNSSIKNCDYPSKAEHVIACSSSYIYNKRILTKQCICNLPAIVVFQIIKRKAGVRPHVFPSKYKINDEVTDRNKNILQEDISYPWQVIISLTVYLKNSVHVRNQAYCISQTGLDRTSTFYKSSKVQSTKYNMPRNHCKNCR